MLKIIIAGLVTIIAAAVVAWIQGWFKRKEPKLPTEQKILQLDRKPRIVIVDDDPKDLEQCRLTLNGDYEVHTYRRPLKALADIILDCDRGEVAELILLDFMMEPIDGPAMVKIIRACQKTNQSKIAFFTRMGKLIDKPTGVAAILRKPEDHLYLRDKVEEILNG